MAQHNELGAWGENVAREYLITKGYAIMEYDTRRGHFEVDVIALKDNLIIFVEVKTRSSGLFDPLDAITPQKIRNICRAANSFVRRYNFHQEVQFDVIAIIGTPESGYEIEHIPDAFQPPLGGYR